MTSLDLRKKLIGLEKCHSFHFAGEELRSDLWTTGATAAVLTDLDLVTTLAKSLILVLLSVSSSLSSKSYLSFVAALPRKDCVLIRRLAERRKVTAMDLERRKDGSVSERLEASPPLLKKEKEEEAEAEEEEDELELETQPHGRTVAQTGQRLPRRSRRQVGQTPVRRLLEGCFGHFHGSSSTTRHSIYHWPLGRSALFLLPDKIMGLVSKSLQASFQLNWTSSDYAT